MRTEIKNIMVQKEYLVAVLDEHNLTVKDEVGVFSLTINSTSIKSFRVTGEYVELFLFGSADNQQFGHIKFRLDSATEAANVISWLYSVVSPRQKHLEEIKNK